jgi:endoglucanase
MKLANCVWQPEIVQAITAVEPLEIPAWGFGFRGAGESYEVASALPLEQMRDTDAVTIRYATTEPRGNHWFEQTDGRDYTESERMVVDLAAGDWLEFELDGSVDAARVSVDDGTAPVAVTATTRGFRVTASDRATIARIRIAQQ